MKAPSNNKEITQTWIEYMLSEHESKIHAGTKVTVTFFNVVPATKPGESFNADLVCLDVKSILEGGGRLQGSSEEKEYNLIVKFLSQEPFNRYMIQLLEYNIRELVMYRNVINDLNKYQTEKTGNKYPINIPKYVYGKCNTSEYVLVMENLKPIGYTVASKKEGFDFDEARIAVEHLARLHAVSYAYNKDNNFLEKYSCFKFNNNITRLYEAVVIGSVENTIKYLKSTGRSDNLELIENFKKGSQLSGKFSGLWEDQTRHKILCLTHGDFWINNLLFKFGNLSQNGHKYIESLQLIDWQLSQWNNPLMDLHYLINTSTTMSLRNNHLNDILRHYHHSFSKMTEDLNVVIPDWDYETFKAEYDRLSLVGFLMGMCLIQGTLSKAGEHINEEHEVCQSVICYPFKFITDSVKNLAARCIVPLAFKPSSNFILQTFVKNILKPIGTELASGQNTTLNERLQDLIDEAKNNGIFEVMVL